MFINQRTVSLTLLASLLFILASVEAHEFSQPLRRDHDGLKRLIRKRAPADLLGGLENVVPDPNASATDSASAAASASASADISGGSAVVSPSDTVGLNATDSASIASSSASSVSISSASASDLSSTTTTTTTSPSPTPTPNTDDDTANVAHSLSTITQTASSIVAAAETGPPQQQNAVAQKNSTITTILIAVAASVGGLAILWTIFRKWKLGHSKKFNERMDPINWQPTNDDDIIPTHRLARTDSRGSSIHTSSHHGHAAGGYRDPALDHDFTGAPAHLAPVGGYADLTRGPSPQPQMQESMTRGPSINRSYGAAYDTGLPLHHQAGYGNPGPDAYDYNGDAVRF